MRQLLPAALFLIASAPVAAGTTQVVGSTIDTQGYDSLLIKAKLGAITATGVATLKAAQGEVSDGSDKADLLGSAVVANDTMSNKYLIIEIHRIGERYVTPILTRATANVVVEGIEVILFNPTHEPVNQTNVAASVALVTPDQGTA